MKVKICAMPIFDSVQFKDKTSNRNKRKPCEVSVKQRYDIDRLEWQQFEELAYKSLQYDISSSIIFIEGGRDKGRDFEYNGQTNFFNKNSYSQKYIFQAKHKSTSNSFSSLKKDLKKELEKVFVRNNLKYDTYCLVTNVSITGSQYDTLNAIFDQFLSEYKYLSKIEFKIYSYRNIESCIDKNDSLKWLFPAIIRNTDFKLLLEEIFAKNEINITTGWLSVFEKNKKNFINTSVFSKAIDCIDANNLLLLSGPSKSGKSFNADMLLFNLFCNFDFAPYKIDNIDDFDKFYDKNKKQAFLFDDAFGKYNIDNFRADSFNRKMEYLFELIDDNHKCIFTSREYIFKAFLDYSEAYIKDFITKITVAVFELSDGEKESIFFRYYKNNIESKPTISDGMLRAIITHKNFSPETVRAYFSNCTKFYFSEFIKHLDFPDEYLEKDFENLNEDKKIVILSTLLSLKGDHTTISYCFENIKTDLDKKNLLSLRAELEQLDGSILTNRNDTYQFYHPSMFDFFIRYISKDLSSYRNIVFKNFNIDILNVFRFNPVDDENMIKIDKTNIDLLNIGFKRLINTPELSISIVNSILDWTSTIDFQLNFKLLFKNEYSKFNSNLSSLIMGINFSNFINERIYDLGDFFGKISFNHQGIKIDDNIINRLLNDRKKEQNYWYLVFKLTPLIDSKKVFEFVDREWFQVFYSSLQFEINELGKELYGDAYPRFIESKMYQELIDDKNPGEALKIKNKYKSDHKQKTNKFWYPRYKVCKEKVVVLKSSQPFGYKLYKELIPNFSHIQSLEENQMNRYIFNKKKDGGKHNSASMLLRLVL